MEESSFRPEDDALDVEDTMHVNILHDHNAEESNSTYLRDDSVQEDEMLPAVSVESNSRPSKRPREQDEEENWITAGRNGKRCSQKVDLYINSSEKLPKQFEFAKILKSNGIEKVSRVKYVNPYKIFLQFEGADNAEKLINCKTIHELGWRCQKPLEVVISYGVIKDVELELSEKNILEIISTDRDLVAVKRLKRRNKDGNGWEESESVRLAFKGSSLPAWIYIYGMKINVEPYVFPVTQCSRCWRFGHSLRFCPSKKTVCPKCGKGHANCEITSYKCINCTGNHLSLDRSCPAFKKEKRLRDLMAEYNCSYRKALQIYVPPNPPSEIVEILNAPLDAVINSGERANTQKTISYASVTSTAPYRKNIKETADILRHSMDRSNIAEICQENPKKRKNKKKKHNAKEVLDWDMSSDFEAVRDYIENESESERYSRREKQGEQERREAKDKREELKFKLNFKQLIRKLVTIFSNSQDDLKTKIIHSVVLVAEWLMSIVGEHFWELPFKNIFGI